MTYRTRLGEFEINDDEIITFPKGIPGFEELKKFIVLSLPETDPIKWLVSLDDESVAFPIIDPWLVLEDYEVDLSNQDLELLQVQDPSDIVVLSIVTIPIDKPQEATVNLKAPIVINIKKGRGLQVILEKYELKHPITKTENKSTNVVNSDVNHVTGTVKESGD
ncbi:flagellar assembly protein FliW [Fervidobacterium sp.]